MEEVNFEKFKGYFIMISSFLYLINVHGGIVTGVTGHRIGHKIFVLVQKERDFGSAGIFFLHARG